MRWRILLQATGLTFSLALGGLNSGHSLVANSRFELPKPTAVHVAVNPEELADESPADTSSGGGVAVSDERVLEELASPLPLSPSPSVAASSTATKTAAAPIAALPVAVSEDTEIRSAERPSGGIPLISVPIVEAPPLLDQADSRDLAAGLRESTEVNVAFAAPPRSRTRAIPTAVTVRALRPEDEPPSPETILPPLPLEPETEQAAELKGESSGEPEPIVAAPADTTEPAEYDVDGITLRNQPLTKISRDVVRRASNRKTATDDFAAAHFDKYPCVAYGITRSPEGIPTITAPTAGDFCYRPLFFEEKNLERYGRSHGLIQPVISGARFFATIPALPYLAATNHPGKCYDWQYPYPAGFPAPRVRELPPLDLEGGLVESGVAIGLIFLIP